MRLKFKIAVVGVGYWGPNLVRNFLRLENVQVMVCDLDKNSLKRIKTSYPMVSTTTNYQQVLSDPGVRAVVVATPVKNHYDLASKALIAGKDVLVEKPMTKTLSEAEKLVALAKKQNKVLMVDHTFLFSGPVLKIKELLQKKVLGNLWYYYADRANLGKLQKDVNVLWDLAVHDLSILNFIQDNQPTSLLARGSYHAGNEIEEIAGLVLTYPKNFFAYINVSWLSPVKTRKIVLAGDKKMLVFDDALSEGKLKIFNCQIKFQANKVNYLNGDSQILTYADQEPLLNMAEQFIKAVSQNKRPLTDGHFGLAVVKQLTAANKSLLTNRPIKL